MSSRNNTLDPRKPAIWQASFVVVSALIFVWSHRFLPLQDYPDWLTQGKLFSDLLRGQLASEYTFKAAPVPNSVVTVCIGLLSLWFEPEVAGKLLLSAYVVGYAAAVSWLLGIEGRTVRLTLVASSLLLICNYAFFHGELNYALGVVVLFAGQAMVLRAGAEPGRGALIAVVAGSIVIYACHGAAYAAWLMFLVAFAWVSRSARTRVAFVLAIAPSLVLAAIYTLWMLSQPKSIVLGWSLGATVRSLGEKLWLVLRFLCPFQAFYPYLEPPIAELLLIGNLVAIGLAAWALVRWFKSANEASLEVRAARACLLLYGVAFLVAPGSVAGLLRPSERLVLPAFQLIVLCMARSGPTAPSSRSTLAWSWTALVIQAIYLHGYGGYVSRELASTHNKLRTFVETSALSVLHESHFRFDGRPHRTRPLVWRVLPTHYPLNRITYYASLEARRPVPVFDTGLFRSRSTYLPNSADELAHVHLENPVAIMGWAPGNQAIRALLPPATTTLANDRTFIVVDPSP